MAHSYLFVLHNFSCMSSDLIEIYSKPTNPPLPPSSLWWPLILHKNIAAAKSCLFPKNFFYIVCINIYLLNVQVENCGFYCISGLNYSITATYIQTYVSLVLKGPILSQELWKIFNSHHPKRVQYTVLFPWSEDIYYSINFTGWCGKL